MHPSVRMKEPGNCPICSMETVPVWKKDYSQTDTTSQTKTDEKYPATNGEDMAGMPGHDHSTMGELLQNLAVIKRRSLHSQ